MRNVGFSFCIERWRNEVDLLFRDTSLSGQNKSTKLLGMQPRLRRCVIGIVLLRVNSTMKKMCSRCA